MYGSLLWWAKAKVVAFFPFLIFAQGTHVALPSRNQNFEAQTSFEKRALATFGLYLVPCQGSEFLRVAVLASVLRVRSVPLHAGMEAFLERLRTGLGTHAPVLTGYGLETEADFAQLRFDDVAAEEVWALLEANGCKRLQARAILKGMSLDPETEWP